jgi:hypothetical protein
MGEEIAVPRDEEVIFILIFKYPGIPCTHTT